MTLRTLLNRVRNVIRHFRMRHPPRPLTDDEIRRMRLINPQFAHLMRDHNYDPARHKVIFSHEPLSQEQAQALTRHREGVS
jgi:hypothetical protein